MSGVFWWSYAALWLLVASLVVNVILAGRRARTASIQGPGLSPPNAVPTEFPRMTLEGWQGGSIAVPEGGMPHMVLFGRSGCDFCRLALEAAVSLADGEDTSVRWVFVYSGTRQEAEVITARLSLGAVRFALGGDGLLQRLKIATMPYVIAVDSTGKIAAHEAIKNRRHLESLARPLRAEFVAT